MPSLCLSFFRSPSPSPDAHSRNGCLGAFPYQTLMMRGFVRIRLPRCALRARRCLAPIPSRRAQGKIPSGLPCFGTRRRLTSPTALASLGGRAPPRWAPHRRFPFDRSTICPNCIKAAVFPSPALSCPLPTRRAILRRSIACGALRCWAAECSSK